MERILILLSLFFSLSANAATNSGIPQDAFGGGGIANVPSSLIVEESNPQGYFTLFAGGNAGAANFAPFFRNGSAAPYRVRTGFYADCRNITFTGGAGNLFQLVTASSQINQGVAALAGGVFQGGAAANYTTVILAANVWQSLPITYSVSSDFYFAYQQNSGAAYYISVLCKEKAL